MTDEKHPPGLASDPSRTPGQGLTKEDAVFRLWGPVACHASGRDSKSAMFIHPIMDVFARLKLRKDLTLD